MALSPDAERLAHRYADVGGLRLHYVEMGSGPLVVLLHGFPDFWYSWRHQLPALAAAGYRAVAVDQRGYNLSDKPRGVRAYDVGTLARDVADLVAALGEERATVVGHDWGGMVAWTVAMRHSDVIERLVILNAPHPERFVRALATLRQLRKSWYMAFFQLPRLPEALIRRDDFASLRRLLKGDPVRPDAFTDADIERYVEALARPGALTAALNYYRALVRRDPRRAASDVRRTDAPVLVVWGERDRYLGPELAAPSAALVPNARVERLPDASHWVHHDSPERVNALLLDFLGGSRSPA